MTPRRRSTRPAAAGKRRQKIDAEAARQLLGRHNAEDTEPQIEIINDIPRPERDPRDPYGRIERGMLHNRTGSYDHDVQQKWKAEHPEFAAEYEAEKEARPDAQSQ